MQSGIPCITGQTSKNLLAVALRDEVRKALQRLSHLESVTNELTVNATEGERWRISSQACELVSRAQQAIMQLELLIDEAAHHWPP